MRDLRSVIPHVQQLVEVGGVIFPNHVISLLPRLLTALPITCSESSRIAQNPDRGEKLVSEQTQRIPLKRERLSGAWAC
jgi:hypothetical protein